MSARGDILSAIARARRKEAPRPAPYSPTPIPDRLERFMKAAAAAAADVRVLEREADIPAAVAELLRARNSPARIHAHAGSALARLAWTVACEHTPPGPDDTAVTDAPVAIAETGTLCYPARNTAPASWHFRAGLEIAVLRATDIVGAMEDALARVAADGMPPTLNFVTGPSRTGDIEQTLELGAHGPKALVVLVIKD